MTFSLLWRLVINKIWIRTLETKPDNRLEPDLWWYSIGLRRGRLKNIKGETLGPGGADNQMNQRWWDIKSKSWRTIERGDNLRVH